MKIHEYQARALLAGADVPVPDGEMVTTVEDAVLAADRLLAGSPPVIVVKAQVHAGGRGKAGFVKVVHTAEEVKDAATFMLGNRMVSPQTPPEGLEVDRLLIAEGVDIEREIYLAITTDRARRTNTLIASAEGGVEIEQVAEERPDAILKVPMDPLDGLSPFQARDLAFRLGLKGKQVRQFVSLAMNLAQLFIETDASLAEINPLVVTPSSDEHPDGQVIAIDAKFNFDDNALYRQRAIAELFDPTEEDPDELRAREVGLNFVALEGNIGCLVNGAGLAMSTMDIIKLHGGEPANFLDVGGDATQEAVTEAFRIILSEKSVKGVLVNIFGGIMQCDRIARAIVAAAEEVGFEVPLIVRLEGTNVDAARVVLEEAQERLPTMRTAIDLGDAAKQVCAAVA
ncbi:MAG: ADP-forming succinate--CoA ligase subunit beta [Phycisphaerales bacterium]|jgi:succinyl-CoA synthetase beta subunit|nr:ADP-forming succinate--CoA ligase subunit beta [Planctomycetaceae bacterium]MDP6158861.1 ADP-forming succinate--CoA ligase subunit beta [Phycisphaerales bacterium]MDP6311072.1 ADP-forming succinate--CoA ligase subunit beta [Phycisphaerales bacterium]MDP7086460.1 ADP-forming succinate--CoA ligase subunit beta [Phycisphaerales bacterium]MDP7189243.1 ADP-forming succinate--CoA ligase subunit beta [Phycisphaerales bacterium]|tara:strand:+ start:546 stop:1742 length:1197 start_codon:yes stop_codon:yes gene_type:complete